MKGILEGVRVLDLSRYLAGPYCCAILADMGAEVIRIEEPGGSVDRKLAPFAPDGVPIRHYMVNRNKKVITLNLEHPKGKELFHRLLKKADIFVDNLSPRAKEKLGVTYEALSKVNPDIIVVSSSAFGSYGPYSERLGFDPIAQAECGQMAQTGFPDGPPARAAVGWCDLGTGFHAALGAVAALFHRYRTGHGQMVETSLFDTAASLMAFPNIAARWKILGTMPNRGNVTENYFGDIFKTTDGWVYIIVINDAMFKRLAQVIGHPELADDPGLQTDWDRYVNRDLIYPHVAEWVASKTMDETADLCQEGRVPCGRVQPLSRLADDPHVRAREMLVDMDVPGVGPMPHAAVAIKFSETPLKIRHIAPSAGENNESVYCSLLELSPDDLSQLAAEGVI
jgi:crotonobetainyl-CoA:carnitine CoA-transferase CaiB-like acyl-CoA transferase